MPNEQNVLDVWFANYKQINDAPTFRRRSRAKVCAEELGVKLPKVDQLPGDETRPVCQVTVAIPDGMPLTDIQTAQKLCDDALRGKFRGGLIIDM